MKSIDINSKTVLYIIIPILLVSIFFTYKIFMNRSNKALVNGDTQDSSGNVLTAPTLEDYFGNIGLYTLINTSLIILIMIYIFLNTQG